MENDNKIIVESEHTQNLHPRWHQARRLLQDLTLLVPQLKFRRKKNEIDETTLSKMTPEARKRYEESLTIK